MDDFPLMTVDNCGHNLFHDFASLAFREVMRLDESVEEFSALTVLCDDVDRVVVPEVLVHLDDIRVVLDEHWLPVVSGFRPL